MVVSGAMDLKNDKKWLNAIDSELKSTRAIGTSSDIAGVPSCILNNPQNATSTRWAFKVKSYGSSKERQAVLEWRRKHGIDCAITFVCRFDLLVIASAKRLNVLDVQNVLFSWFLDKSELKLAIHFSKLYRVKEHSCS